jgi:hypothetical protein
MGSVIAQGPEVTTAGFSLDIVSQWPLGVAQIIVNGAPQVYLYPTGNPYRITATGTVETGGRSAWIAVHVSGMTPNPFTIGSIQFAHSNPVYISVPGKPLVFDGPDALYYVEWINDVWSLAQTKGFASNADRNLTAARLDEAKRVIRSRTIHAAGREPVETPPTPENGAHGDGLSALADGPPAISCEVQSGGRALRFLFGPSNSLPETFELYNVAGRRLATRRLDQRQTAGGSWTWNESGSGVTLSSGVYFAVFRGHDWSRTLQVTVVR